MPCVSCSAEASQQTCMSWCSPGAPPPTHAWAASRPGEPQVAHHCQADMGGQGPGIPQEVTCTVQPRRQSLWCILGLPERHGSPGSHESEAGQGRELGCGVLVADVSYSSMVPNRLEGGRQGKSGEVHQPWLCCGHICMPAWCAVCYRHHLQARAQRQTSIYCLQPVRPAS